MDKMDPMKILVQVASVLVIVGALNWLLVGLLEFNLVQKTVGDKDKDKMSVLERAVYILVGLSAVYLVANKYMMKQQ